MLAYLFYSIVITRIEVCMPYLSCCSLDRKRRSNKVSSAGGTVGLITILRLDELIWQSDLLPHLLFACQNLAQERFHVDDKS
jgi:hypothetical protein